MAVAADPIMPIFTAATPMSLMQLSICASTMLVWMGWTA